MEKRINNLLISIGTGYHPGVRLLHSMVKGKSNSSVLILNLTKNEVINEGLQEDYSIRYDEFKNTIGMLEAWLSKGRFDLIGISFMSHHRDIFAGVTKTIRQALPNAKIIAGGVHAWHVDPEWTIKQCDYVCAAEGEEAYSMLVDAMSAAKGKGPLRIPGLMERVGEEVIYTKPGEYMPIDSLPVPSIGSKDFYELTSIGDNPVLRNSDSQRDSPFRYISIGRGCPFRCTFCINSVIGDKKVRIRSVDSVIKEIKELKTVNKPKAVIFMDEIFPLKKEWLDEFVLKYRKEVALPFMITLYPGKISYEQARALKDAGLKEISIGIQTGSESVRKDIYNRYDKNEKITEENGIFSRLKLMAYYDFIIKNPFESEGDYQKSLELVRGLKHPFYLKFYTLALYPKHPITEMAVRRGLVKPGQIDATIGYLDVTTPHRLAITRHYHAEGRLTVWHRRLIQEARNGSSEALCCLVMAYYGFWFMPRPILDFVYTQFRKKNFPVVYAFASLMQSVLAIRNNKLFKKIDQVISVYSDYGFLYLAGKAKARVGGMLRWKR